MDEEVTQPADLTDDELKGAAGIVRAIRALPSSAGRYQGGTGLRVALGGYGPGPGRGDCHPHRTRHTVARRTAQQDADCIKLALEANPSLHDEDALTEFVKLFWRGRNVDRQYVPLRNEAINETPRPTDGEL
ncbi:MAG TPA: hypothetical protein VHZ03_30185 [Trebonia sp.]|jgi:hypothetical protein|nr:hypothetical protein [Trebonia sp.]